MTSELKTFEQAVEFHGHTCPGIALGYRAAKAALQEIRSGRDVDEEILAIVENDACGIDAIQVLTGCTIGKGNLIFRDYGKHVYTFLNRATGDAVRVAERSDFTLDRIDDTLGLLRRKVMQNTATPDEEREFRRRSGDVVKKILEMPAEKIFSVTHVKLEPEEKARIFGSVKCGICGEMVAESRARVRDGKIVCIPCSGHYSRGW